MSFFDKIYDISHTDLFKYVFHSGSDKVFVANISKISTFNENVFDSKWTLTSHTLRLVAASQQIRVCEASVTCSLLMITTSRWQKDVWRRYVPIVGLINRSLFPAQFSQICCQSSEINLLSCGKNSEAVS